MRDAFLLDLAASGGTIGLICDTCSFELVVPAGNFRQSLLAAGQACSATRISQLAGFVAAACPRCSHSRYTSVVAEIGARVL